MIPQKFLNQWAKELNAKKVSSKVWEINLTDKVFIELTWRHANHDFDIDFLDVAPLGNGRILAPYTSSLPVQFLHSIVGLAKDYAIEKDLYYQPNPNISFREYITKRTGLKFTLLGY